MTELEVRLKSRQNTDEEIHIIAITEVNSKTVSRCNEICEFQINGYDMFYVNQTPDEGRGLIVYAKQDLEATPVVFNMQFQESVWISIPINSNKKDNMLVGCIYRSPNSPDYNNRELLQLLNEANSTKFSRILILGDFNFPHINWELECVTAGGGNETAKFLDAVKDNFLFQHIRTPTRSRSYSRPNILDLVFTRDEDSVESLIMEAPLGHSDHGVISFKLCCDKEITVSNTIKYLYDKGDYTSMAAELSSVDWTQHFDHHFKDDVESQWQFFKNIYTDIVNKYIPKRTAVTSCSGNDRKGKYSKDIAISVRKKHRLWQRYMETRDGQKYAAYVQARNKTKSLIKQHQSEVCKLIATKAKSNPKKFWSYINGKTKVKSEIPNLVKGVLPDGSNDMTTSTCEKAEVLSDFFSSVFTLEPPGEPSPAPPRDIKQPMIDIDFSQQLVEARLANLNTSKSVGPDNVHPRVLKELKGVISLPLSIIFRTSYATGAIPEDWKLANVTAVHKKSDKTIADNYRPISLTSIICKIMEGIISNALVNHMKTNKLFTNKQFGFLKGRSATLQLLNVIDEWTKLLDDGVSVDVLYTDFQKAFDTVPHRRLLVKLASYGITGKVLTWIQSFLTGRKQRVVIKGQKSMWKWILSGVPQGSVLGPILFLIYINDIVENLNCTAYLFADDMKIFSGIRSDIDIDILQDDINTVARWTDKWHLKLNTKKCKIMTIGRSYTGPAHIYHLPTGSGSDSDELARVTQEKDLGVLIDSDLRFENHILEKVKICNRITGVIKRNFMNMNFQSFKQLYKAMIRSHLEYAQTVWSPYRVKLIEEVEKVQKRATKILPGLRHLSYTHRLQKLQLPTLVYRRARGDMIEVFKIIHGYYDQEGVPHLQLSSYSNTRGHDKKLFKLQSYLDLRKYSFTARVVSKWNSLPADIVNAPSVDAFKGRLDRFWSSQEARFNYKAEFEL